MRMKWSYLAILLAAVMILSLTGCGYNKIQGLEEEVKAAWAEVQNQYQRRYDLIPNLVSTVKGYASHEKETFEAITNARSKVGSINVSPEILQDAGKFKQFQQSQAQLGSAISRLLLVAERYPDLKASANFRDLQAQLEGTENRIAVARRRYIQTVAAYNKSVRYFPTNLTAKYILHMETMETFAPESTEVEKAPTVNF